MVQDFKSPLGIKNRVFGVLERAPIEVDTSLKPTRTPSGDVLPYLLNAYQTGRVSHVEALRLAIESHEECKKQGYFVSEREADIVRRALIAMFDPAIHAKFSYPIEEGIKLLRELKAQNKFLLIGLTNWDGASFDIIQDAYRDCFELFDDIVVSGKVGRLKPNDDAFEEVLKKYNLKQEECVFLDDQQENIEAARALGIPSILFRDYYEARQELHELGVLSEGPKGVSLKQRNLILMSLTVAAFIGYYFYE
jgi:FMN phosphatase YigB (HAD superfamily)